MQAASAGEDSVERLPGSVMRRMIVRILTSASQKIVRVQVGTL